MNMVVWKERSLNMTGFTYPHEEIDMAEGDFRLRYVTGNSRDIFSLSLNSVNNTNASVTVTLKIHSRIDQRPWKYYFSLELEWKNYFMLSGTFRRQQVSVPGHIFKVSVSVDERHNNLISTDSLQAQWINDRYSRYTNFTPQLKDVNKYCKETVLDEKWCNYSSYQKQGFFVNKYYYIFESETLNSLKVDTFQTQLIHSRRWSHHEADTLCRSIGGTLPYFLDREELKELIDFLRNSPHIFSL